MSSGTVYPALVRNKAQLTYNAVGAWLEGTSPAPPKVAASADLQAQLKLQNDVAQALKETTVLPRSSEHRHQRSASDRPE